MIVHENSPEQQMIEQVVRKVLLAMATGTSEAPAGAERTSCSYCKNKVVATLDYHDKLGQLRASRVSLCEGHRDLWLRYLRLFEKSALGIGAPGASIKE